MWSCKWECPPCEFSSCSCSRQQWGVGRSQRPNRNSWLDQVVQVCWRRWRKNLQRQRRHLVIVGDSLLHWQPVERPEKWSSICSTSVLTGDSGQVVLSPLQHGFTVPPQTTCASALPRKRRNTKIAFFSLKCCIRVLPEFIQSLLDVFKLFDSQLILTLMYDSLNLVINAFSSGLLGAWF